MTKIELEIMTTEWKIEDEEKELERIRQKIEDGVKKEYFRENETEMIASYANDLARTYAKLRLLREQLKMLKRLAKED